MVTNASTDGWHYVDEAAAGTMRYVHGFEVKDEREAQAR